MLYTDYKHSLTLSKFKFRGMQKSSKCSLITIEDNHSLVYAANLDLYLSCHSSMITVVKQTYQVSMISIANQVTSSWHIVWGLVHSTLDANRWQLHAVQPCANACKEALHQTLKLVAIKWEIQVEASIKAKGQLYCYLSITQYSPYIAGPTHLTPPIVKRELDSKRLCVLRLMYHSSQLYW